MSSADKPPSGDKFRIAIIGSGPIGKLLACSVTPHPRITYDHFEAEELPLQPSFGYEIGPQTLQTTKVLNPALGSALYEKCILSETWMNFFHGGKEDRLIEAVKVPDGRIYGRLGRQELLDLLDSHAPSGYNVQHDKRLVDIKKLEEGLLQLKFHDNSTTTTNAVWACDGMNSFCRKYLQDGDFNPSEYSGTICFRGKVPAAQVASQVGTEFAEAAYMFIGVDGWHMLVNPIEKGEWILIAAFAIEPEYTKNGTDHAVTVAEIVNHFPGRSEKVDKMLKLIDATPGGPQRLELTTQTQLGAFYNTELCMTSFGDAASGMLPHIAGSMSTGFMGVTAFLHEGLNPLLDRLSSDATNEEIAGLILEASALYDVTHRPLAQKLLDFTTEQGTLWNGGIVDVEELTKRPRFLWSSADDQR